MKILLAANINSTHTLKWVKALVNEGLEVAVFSLTDIDENNHDVPQNTRVYTAGISQNKNSSSGKWGKMKYLFSSGQLKRILKTERPDILHSHYASSYGFIGARSSYHPFIVSVWGSDVFEFPRSSAIARRMIRYTFRKADRILSTSRIMAEEIQRYSEKMAVLTPFGIDMNLFSPQSVRIIFSADDIVIGCVKSLEPVYGHRILLEAFASLKQRRRDISLKLLLVGDGSLRRYLENESEILGISSDVHFAGNVAQNVLSQYFSSMDIAVLPSLQESFGVSALEAAACEVPVIASNVGGMPEVVDNGNNGLLFETGNVIALTNALDELVIDKDRRVKMGKAGRNWVKEHYEFSGCLKKMMDVYKDVLKSEATEK